MLGKQPSFFIPANSFSPRVEKKAFNHLVPDFLKCIPIFVEQLKLRGLTIDKSGGKIIMQIAHRVFGGKLQEQPEYTLINTETDFVAFLCELKGEDVGLVINLLLDNLSQLEIELLVTFVLQQEHRERSDDFARGESLAGQLVQMISARVAREFFNNVMIGCVKDIEIFIERHPKVFSRYYGNQQNEPVDLSATDQQELNRLLCVYLDTICLNYDKLPALFRLECRILNDLNFQISKLNVVLVNAGINMSPRATPKASRYIVNYGDDKIELYYMDSKGERTDVDIDSVPDLRMKLNTKNSALIEENLVPYHNERHLKRNRKIGLINTRFIGYMISTRSEELFNKTSDFGLTMISALNKLLIESLHLLATNKPVKDNFLKGFVTPENKLKLNGFYSAITYISEKRDEQLPDVDNEILVSEQKIVFIALLSDIFRRFQDICAEIKSVRNLVEKPKLVRLRKTNEDRIQELVIDHGLSMKIAKYCDLLNVISHYREKARELSKINGIYRETMELCLIYILETLLKPALSMVEKIKPDLFQYVLKIKPSESYLLDILAFIHYIASSEDVATQHLSKIIQGDAQHSAKVSYDTFIAHTREYLTLFHTDFNLERQIAVLKNDIEKTGLIML